MRKGLLGSIAALTVGAGLAFAQPPARIIPPSPPPVNLVPGNPAAEALPLGTMPGPMGAGPQNLMPYAGNPGLPPGALGNLYCEDPLGPGPNRESGYANFETLLWFIRSMPSTYPLITAGTNLAQGSQPDLGTTTLFGAQNFHFNPFVGARFTFGRWFPSNPEWGVEWSPFILENRVDRFVIGVGEQVLARPFINATTGLPDSFIIASPGFASGGVEAKINSQLWGMEFNLQRKLYADSTKNFTFLLGLRYLDLKEDLSVASQSFFLPAATTFFYGLGLTGPHRIDVEDSFDNRNQYFVPQIGFQGEYRYRRWVLQWGTKIGLGDVRETSDITGLSRLVLTPGEKPNEVPGGLLALSSNLGKAHQDRFVFVPEFKIQAGYRMFRNVDLGIGYSMLYLSRAIRPSEQIDPSVNPAFIPTSAIYSFPAGPFRPKLTFTQSDLWMQGLNFSMNVHY